MNFSIRPSLKFLRLDSEAWSCIVNDSDRAWLPFCYSPKSLQRVTAPARSDSLRDWLDWKTGQFTDRWKNKNYLRNTDNFKANLRNTDHFKVITPDERLRDSPVPCQCRAWGRRRCRTWSPKRVSLVGRAMARKARRAPANRLERAGTVYWVCEKSGVFVKKETFLWK